MSEPLVILDSVAAARAWLGRATPAVELLSTHMSVVGFLASHGITCQDISEGLTADEAAVRLRQASADIGEMLAQLDSSVGAEACKAGGLPRLALFGAAFKYFGQYNLAGMRSFESKLEAKLADGKYARVEFLHAVDTSVDPVFSFVVAAAHTCAARQVAFTATAVKPPSPPPMRRLWAAGLRATGSPRGALERVLGRARRALGPRLRAGVATVLLIDPEHDSFFEDALHNTGVRLVRIDGDGRVRGSEPFRAEASSAAERMRAVLEKWLAAGPGRADGVPGRCVAELARRTYEVLEPMIVAQRIAASFAVIAAAWDVPLVTRMALNLVAEALLGSGVRVLGRQHGANYVDQRLGSIHFDSDFDRCTHYFSYGFSSAEFREAYPEARPRCVFEPAGGLQPVLPRRRERVDIAFPIGNCVPHFYFARMPESELVRRQRAVLEAMDARSDLDCVVKPPPGYSHDNFAHMEALAALRNARVVDGTWTGFLARSVPRLAVFETASTPLAEVLAHDVDVFLMLDPLFPFTEQAFALLRRRVQVFDTVEELAAAILAYGREGSPRLRDSAYYETYVNRGSASRVREVLALRPVSLRYRLTA